MNKDEFLERTVMGGLMSADRELLLKCFDENGEMNKEHFIDFSLMQLQSQTIARIKLLNKAVAEALHEFEYTKQWTNLHQIFRSLPGQIARAARDSHFEEEWKDFANQVDTFLNLGDADRKRALELIKEERDARPTGDEISGN